MNLLYRMSDYFDSEERIPASKLLLPQIFQEFGESSMRENTNLHLKNGIVIATMENRSFITREKYTNKDKRSGVIDPFHNIKRDKKHLMNVHNYSDVETETALMHYFDAQTIRFQVNRPMVQQVRVVNDANPRKIFHYIKDGWLSAESIGI